MLKLPGLIDPHVHMREPGGEYKEDWDSGTAAALAGGFTLVLAMPNTQPPVTNAETLEQALTSARHKARCDYAQYLGAGPDNAVEIAALAGRSAGLKMYLDQTFGPLRLDDMTLWMQHFERWPKEMPMVVHAESRSMAAALLLAELFDRPLHVAHVSLREEILLIRKAKERGLKVTCEVTPHHLFPPPPWPSPILLKNGRGLGGGSGRLEVRPRLNSPADRQALWDNLEVIDCFATDHAPHTPAEKDGPNPPPGFPGLETALPLLLGAVHAGRLTLEDVLLRCHTNPRRIFRLPEQPDTWIEVDAEAVWDVRAANAFTRCGWTPYEGQSVRGRVERVVLRGKEAYREGKVTAERGTGKNVREMASTER